MRHSLNLSRITNPRASEQLEKAASDRTLLQLARIALIFLMSVLGVLINSYLDAMHKSIGDIAHSIERVGETQRQLSLTLTRIDANLSNIERRVGKIENRLDAGSYSNP